MIFGNDIFESVSEIPRVFFMVYVLEPSMRLSMIGFATARISSSDLFANSINLPVAA